MTKQKKSPKVSKKSQSEDSENTCTWCGKTFMRDSSLLVHLCEKKARWQNKDEKWSLIAYHAWKTFFDMNSPQKKKSYTIHEFVQSRYYGDFVKLGWFLYNRQAIANEKYISYVLKAGLKPKEWVKESVYQEWVADYVKTESPSDGIERSIRYMDKWASDNGTEFNLYFSIVSTTAAVRHLLNGYISPWIIYLSDRASDLLNRMDNHQLSVIEPVINPLAWNIRLNNKKSETKEIKDILKRYNL